VSHMRCVCNIAALFNKFASCEFVASITASPMKRKKKDSKKRTPTFQRHECIYEQVSRSCAERNSGIRV